MKFQFTVFLLVAAIENEPLNCGYGKLADQSCCNAHAFNSHQVHRGLSPVIDSNFKVRKSWCLPGILDEHRLRVRLQADLSKLGLWMALKICVVCLFQKDGLEAVEFVDVIGVEALAVDVDLIKRELLRPQHLWGFWQ